MRGPMRPASGFVVFFLLLASVSDAEEDAKAHNNRAMAAFALGHYADAAPEFEKAFELKPLPALLYNAAQAHRLAGNKTRALTLYQNYLRIYGAQVKNGAEVERHIAALQRAIESDATVASAPPLAPAPVASTPASRGVPLVPAAPTETAASPESPAPRKTKPWVWGVVAGAAAVVVTGVVVGAVLGTASQDPSATWGSIKGN